MLMKVILNWWPVTDEEWEILNGLKDPPKKQ